MYSSNIYLKRTEQPVEADTGEDSTHPTGSGRWALELHTRAYTTKEFKMGGSDKKFDSPETIQELLGGFSL